MDMPELELELVEFSVQFHNATLLSAEMVGWFYPRKSKTLEFDP